MTTAQASLCFSPWPFLTAVWHRVCFNGSDDFLSHTPQALQQRQKKKKTELHVKGFKMSNSSPDDELPSSFKGAIDATYLMWP